MRRKRRKRRGKSWTQKINTLGINDTQYQELQAKGQVRLFVVGLNRKVQAGNDMLVRSSSGQMSEIHIASITTGTRFTEIVLRLLQSKSS